MQPPLSIPQDSVYPDWHYQPLRLLKEEIANPKGVIREFFSSYRLPEARKHFKEMLEDAMCAVEVYSVNYLTLYDDIEKLMEAAWLLLTNEKGKQQIGAKTKEDEALTAILQLIITAIHPERIFLLFHEDNRLVDLLIVVPDHSAKPFSYYETIVSTACYSIAEVSFSLHTSSAIKQHLQEAHPFYFFTCAEANEVYRAEAVTSISFLPQKKEEVKTAAQQRFQTSFAKSEAFFHSAKMGFENGEVATAIFLLHQAAELSLRSFVRALTGNDVKEHSLSVLAKHVRRLAPSLVLLLSPATNEERERLLLLDAAYLKGRYSDAFSPNTEQVLYLMQWVQNLRENCNDVFNNIMDCFAS